MMRSILLCVCVVLLSVVCSWRVQVYGGSLDELLIHSNRDARIAQASAETQALQRDWRRSIYNGVDRVDRLGVRAEQPTQIRLAFVPQGMAVTFTTINPLTTPPLVRYGLTQSKLNHQAVGGEPETYGTSYYYTVLLPHLQAHTQYYYQVDGDDTVRQFTTAMKTGDDSPFSVMVVGDMGLVHSKNTINQMKKAIPSTDFVLHIGDLSYADDFFLRPNDTYEGSWDMWLDEMEPITSTLPYMSLPGNHEVTCTEVTPFLCPPNQQNFTAYRKRFRMPSKESGGVENLWYSYDYGSVHFVQIDTESDYPNSPMGAGTFYNAGPFGDQLSWLEADLAMASRRRAQGAVPWIVVSGHRPWYTSGAKCAQTQAAFEQLFLKYGVDIYFSGHVHWYERMWPLAAGGQVTQQDYDNPVGVVYIVNGAGGNVEGHTTGSGSGYTAFVDNTDFGYGKLSVQNSTAIRWQFFRATDGQQVDDITITKTH